MILPVLGGGLVVLLAAPDATPAITGRGVLGWSLAAVGIAALLLRSRALHVAAAVTFALSAEHLLFSPGVPRGHDLLSHSWGVWAFFQAMASGDATPQWLHHISLGLPLPVFYSPAAYYSMTPFFWVGMSPVAILKSGFVTFAVLAAIVMYFVARHWTGSSRAGLVAAAAYAFAPYRLLNSHYRLALGETAAMVVLPLVFGLFFAPGVWSRRRIAAAAVATAVLIITHPLSVLTAGFVGMLWQGLESLREGTGSWDLAAFRMRILAAVLGVAMAGFYVAPMACRLNSVSIDENAVTHWGSDEIRLAGQGLRLTQPLKRLPWLGVRRSEPLGAPKDTDGKEVPLYLGCGLFACALLAGTHGARRARRRRDASEKAPELTVAIIALGALALTLHFSAAALAHLPLLPKLQFAWRFLGPASFAAALASGFVARLLISAHRAPLVALLTALLVADAFPYTGAADWAPAVDGFARFYIEDHKCDRRWGCWETEEVAAPLPLRVYGNFLPPSRFGEDIAHVKPGYGEYLNLRALREVKLAADNGDWERLGVGLKGAVRLDAAPYAQWLTSASARPQRLEFRRRAGTIDVKLPGGPGHLVVLEQSFPGWEASLDGESATVESTPEGLMQVSVAKNASWAHFRFRLRGGDVVTGRTATLLAFAGCLFLARRRTPKR